MILLFHLRCMGLFVDPKESRLVIEDLLDKFNLKFS